jgi:hypothetical protein
MKWLVSKYAPKVYGEKPQPDASGDGPLTITNDPTPPPEPPKQLEYHKPQLPVDLAPEAWSILLDVLELIQRTIPSNSDKPPAEIFGVIREALLAHFREQEARNDISTGKRVLPSAKAALFVISTCLPCDYRFELDRARHHDFA